MYIPRIGLSAALLCLPLFACTVEKGDDSTATTNPASTSGASADSTTTGGLETGTVTTADAETSTTTTASATTANPTTGDDTTGDVVTTGDDTTGAVGTTVGDTTGDGTTSGGDSSTGEPAGLSWATDVYPVIVVNNCNCHGNGAGGLTMKNAVDSYTALLGVESWQSLLDRVKPGDPDNSYLVHKLNGTQESVGGSGLRMPQVGAPLTQDKLDLVEQWISEGAQP